MGRINMRHRRTKKTKDQRSRRWQNPKYWYVHSRFQLEKIKVMLPYYKKHNKVFKGRSGKIPIEKPLLYHTFPETGGRRY